MDIQSPETEYGKPDIQSDGRLSRRRIFGKYAGRYRYSKTDARNFFLLENANMQLIKVVHDEEQHVRYFFF